MSNRPVPPHVPLVNRVVRRLRILPIVMLSLTSRCNARCVMCRYWELKKTDFPLDSARNLAADLKKLKCSNLGLTGGEPLLHQEFDEIVTIFAGHLPNLFLLTNGMLIPRVMQRGILDFFKSFYVSLDGPREIHDTIRGRGSFDAMTEGVSQLKVYYPKKPVYARCTLQKLNWEYLRETVETAREKGFSQISFVTVDPVSEAFGHEIEKKQERMQHLLPDSPDPDDFQKSWEKTVKHLDQAWKRRFIAENETKLHRMLTSLLKISTSSPEPPHCNAPWFSLFINEQEQIAPCFFRPPAGTMKQGKLIEFMTKNKYGHTDLMDAHSVSTYCQTCTCPLYTGFGPKIKNFLQ